MGLLIRIGVIAKSDTIFYHQVDFGIKGYCNNDEIPLINES